MGKQTLPAPTRDGQEITAEQMQAYLGDDPVAFDYKDKDGVVITNHAILNKLQIPPGVALKYASARAKELLASHESNKKSGVAELKALANKVDVKISDPKSEKKKRKVAPEVATETATGMEVDVSISNLDELTDELVERASLLSLHEVVDTTAESAELYEASVDLALAALVREEGGEPCWTIPDSVLQATREAFLNSSGLSQSFVRRVVAWFDPTSAGSAAATQKTETASSPNSTTSTSQTENSDTPPTD